MQDTKSIHRSEVAQSCPTLCNAMDCSLQSFSVHGIFQARVLEWVATLAFLYTNNEKSEREIKESISFTIATKRIKYLGINLPKETKGEGNGNLLQYSCLENPVDSGA